MIAFVLIFIFLVCVLAVYDAAIREQQAVELYCAQMLNKQKPCAGTGQAAGLQRAVDIEEIVQKQGYPAVNESPDAPYTDGSKR